MPQVCKVCSHPQRDAIDIELTRDWERSLRAIGEEYGLSKDSLFRHAQSHLPDAGEDSPTETSSVEFGQKKCAEIRAEKKADDPPEETEARQAGENSAHEKTPDLGKPRIASRVRAREDTLSELSNPEARQVAENSPHEKEPEPETAADPWDALGAEILAVLGGEIRRERGS